MANTFSLADPADGQFDDWLELHNPNLFLVAPTTLSRTTNRAAEVAFLTGATIGAHSFRLVGGCSRTSAAEGDLHDFRLNRGG